METIAQGILFTGTSGLVLPYPGKQHYPAEFRDKPRLTYYASLFNSLEVNSSFYKVPMGKTVTMWAESVPGNFRFTFKLWKEITHGKGFQPRPEDIDRFMDVIENAGDKKGCLLIQLPPSVTVTRENQLELILTKVRPYNGWKTAIEFRHPSWYVPHIFTLADKYEASVVLHDMPASFNMHFNKNASFVYLRFHGPLGDYRGGYSDEELRKYSLHIESWIAQGKDVYVYFNNTIGDAIKNIITLGETVRNVL